MWIHRLSCAASGGALGCDCDRAVVGVCRNPGDRGRASARARGRGRRRRAAGMDATTGAGKTARSGGRCRHRFGASAPRRWMAATRQRRSAAMGCSSRTPGATTRPGHGRLQVVTIAKAISVAVNQASTLPIYVQGGFYPEQVTLQAGLTITGGWSASWSRACSPTIVQAPPGTPTGTAIASHSGIPVLSSLIVQSECTRTRRVRARPSSGSRPPAVWTELHLEYVQISVVAAPDGAPGSMGDAGATPSGACTTPGDAGTSTVVGGKGSGADAGWFAASGLRVHRRTAGGVRVAPAPDGRWGRGRMRAVPHGLQRDRHLLLQQRRGQLRRRGPARMRWGRRSRWPRGAERRQQRRAPGRGGEGSLFELHLPGGQRRQRRPGGAGRGRRSRIRRGAGGTVRSLRHVVHRRAGKVQHAEQCGEMAVLPEEPRAEVPGRGAGWGRGRG